MEHGKRCIKCRFSGDPVRDIKPDNKLVEHAKEGSEQEGEEKRERDTQPRINY